MSEGMLLKPVLIFSRRILSFVFTVTVHFAVLLPAVAVMVADPAFTAVIFPLVSTVATSLLLLDHVAFSPDASPETVSVFVASSSISTFVSLSVMAAGAFTVTEHVAFFVPAVAVMVADPAFTAVTFPLASTVAMEVLLLDHVAFSPAASPDFTVSVFVASSAISTLVSLSVSGVTAAAFTVTEQVAFLVPAVAVMVADPAFTAVTFPLASTEAVEALLDDHVAFSPDASPDFTVSVFVAPSVSSILLSLSVMAVVVGVGVGVGVGFGVIFFGVCASTLNAVTTMITNAIITALILFVMFTDDFTFTLFIILSVTVFILSPAVLKFNFIRC
jgi:hypothetical protein